MWGGVRPGAKLTVPAPPRPWPQERAWNPAPSSLPWTDTWARGLASYVPAYTCSHAPAPFQKGADTRLECWEGGAGRG